MSDFFTYYLQNNKKVLPFVCYELDTARLLFSNTENMPFSCLWKGNASTMGVAINEKVTYTFKNGMYISLYQNSSNTLVCNLYTKNDELVLNRTYGTSDNYQLSIMVCKYNNEYGLDFMYLGMRPYADMQLSTGIPTSENPTNMMWLADYIVPNAKHPNGTSHVSNETYCYWFTNSSGTTKEKYINAYEYIAENKEQPDPYERAGTTEKRGGTGNLDDTSDPIDFPSLPSLNALNTGFVSLYAPTVSQVANLVNYMWSSDFVDSLVKMFTSPIESIIQFGMLPINIASAIDTDVHLCNKSTGVSMNKAINQFIEIDCGSIDVDEYWGSYLDYAPYTKIAIYCPFSDIHELECDDVMGQTLHLKYHIDILSGSFVAFLKCGDSVKYTWGGNMLVQLPITQSNWGQTYSAIAQFGASAVGTVATGGISALASASTLSSASNVMNSKPTVSRSGGIGGASAYMSVKTPYLIIKRPKQALAQNYSTYRGYPSNIEVSLADVSGYTEIESIHLDNIPCTQEEKNEIENLLNKGVIF